MKKKALRSFESVSWWWASANFSHQPDKKNDFGAFLSFSVTSPTLSEVRIEQLTNSKSLDYTHTSITPSEKCEKMKCDISNLMLASKLNFAE